MGTLGYKYILYGYMEPLGRKVSELHLRVWRLGKLHPISDPNVGVGIFSDSLIMSLLILLFLVLQ